MTAGVTGAGGDVADGMKNKSAVNDRGAIVVAGAGHAWDAAR